MRSPLLNVSVVGARYFIGLKPEFKSGGARSTFGMVTGAIGTDFVATMALWMFGVKSPNTHAQDIKKECREIEIQTRHTRWLRVE